MDLGKCGAIALLVINDHGIELERITQMPWSTMTGRVHAEKLTDHYP